MYYIRNYAFYSSLSSYRPLRTSHNNKSFHLDHLLRSFPSLNQFLSHNPESVYLRDHSILTGFSVYLLGRSVIILQWGSSCNWEDRD
nr:hypothetical protein Q903MT_gene1994 [Picea sitchensis]